MSVSKLLAQIRPEWIERVSQQLARGEGVRENFLDQLNRFYDLLQESVSTGDPAWLDPILAEWVASQTQSELDREARGLAPVLTQIMLLTMEICQDMPDPKQGVAILGAVLPQLTYAYERVARKEVELRSNRIAAELTDAQAQLELLDRSKSNFISVAAHELKTPLTLIEGYAAMLRELFPSDDQTSQPVLLLKGIDNGTMRLREIVDDMIDVSLIDNDLLALNFQPIWVNRILTILQRETAPVVAQRSLSFAVEAFQGWDVMTFGDPERLYQAFQHLAHNAIKFTPDGGSITIGGRQLPGFIEVTFKDTGIGIHPQDHSRIFDKFGQLGDIQLHSSGKTKFKGGGAGLGLAIARGIIEAHGGTIWVDSPGYDEELCPGSTFHVLIPLHEHPPDERSKSLFASLTDEQRRSGSPIERQ